MFVDRIASASDELEATLSEDQRLICFTSDRDGDPDIYCADRPAPPAPFRDVRAQTALRSTASERAPALSPDHLELFFSSDRPGGAGGDDLYVARWSDALGEFEAPVSVVELSTADSEGGPSLSADGLDLYFDRRPEGGRSVILRAHREALGEAFTVIGPVEGIASGSSDDLEPTVGGGGRVLVFCTNRETPGTAAGTFSLWCAPGPGGHVWEAARPVVIPGIEGAGACSPELAADGELYFNTAALAGGAGAQDIVGAAP